MRQIFTIGHSNHTAEGFLQLLTDHAIQILVDVRSQPYSRYAPQFNRAALDTILDAASIDYLHAVALGGRPDDSRHYDADGHVLYGRVAESNSFASAIEELEDAAMSSCVAIMCGEEDPSECHRRLLVGRVLRDRGWDLIHIRGDGSLQTEPELAATTGPAGQEGLFEGGEFSTWRSTQSVSPRSRPRGSSDS